MDSEMEPLFNRRNQRSSYSIDSKLSNVELILLGGTMLSIILVSILTGFNLPDKFSKITSDNYGDIVLDIAIIFNLILAIFYLIYGYLISKHFFDILASSFSMGLVTIYIVVDFISTDDAIQDAISVARLVVIAINAPIIFIIIYILIRNYLQNRLMMATKSIIRMYTSLNALFSLLKFDLQLNIIFSLFYLVSDFNKSYRLFYILFLIIYSIVQYIVGRLSLKKELVSSLYFYIFLYTIGIYFIQFEYFWKAKNHQNDPNSQNYLLINQSFLFTCLISLIIRVLIYIQVMNCFKNFGYGLTDDEFVNLAKNNGSLLGQRKRNRLMYM